MRRSVFGRIKLCRILAERFNTSNRLWGLLPKVLLERVGCNSSEWVEHYHSYGLQVADSSADRLADGTTTRSHIHTYRSADFFADCSADQRPDGVTTRLHLHTLSSANQRADCSTDQPADGIATRAHPHTYGSAE